MKKKNDIQEELEGISPFLANLKKEEKDPFKTPRNYFGQMREEVLRKIRPESRPGAAPAGQAGIIDQLAAYLRWLLKPGYAVAFATVLLLIVAGLYYRGSRSADNNPLEYISAEDASQYIRSHLDEFELDLLVEVLQEDRNEHLVPAPQLETEELEEYIDGMIDEMETEELEGLVF